MIYRILALVVILALVGATFFFGHAGVDRDQPTAAAIPPGSSGYSARDAEIVETGLDGKARYRLDADRIDQQPREGTVSLVHVTMHYRTELGTEWVLRANHGELPEDARNVALDGAVRIDGPVTATVFGTRDLEIRTERLNVDTLEQIATTRDLVTIFWAGEQLASRGMRADLKDQQLYLEANVHGRFIAR
jgi:LPS export ABC transporter protein LptC